MKIEKINENQIKIILSRGDLAERNLNINEIAYSNEKMQMLFREMMEQAMMEHSFRPDGNSPLMIEAALLPSDSIMIIVTKVNDAVEPCEPLNLMPKPKEERQFISRGLIDSAAVRTAGIMIYSFANLDDAVGACARFLVRGEKDSALYKHAGRYYLSIDSIRGTKSQTEAAEAALSEYGTKHIGSYISQAYLVEHGELMIGAGAVEKLAGMS